MKLNPTVALTFILLVLMFGAGTLSSTWGFSLGREALKGITQPDGRPTNNVGTRKVTPSGSQDMIILKEEDVLKKVKAITDTGKGEETNKEDKKQEDKKKEDKKKEDKKDPAKQKEGEKTGASEKTGFPLVAKDGEISLEVGGEKSTDDSLVLEVKLKNEGKKAVRFLYSFLDISDDRGRSISASTDGLPGELPANGEAFSGTIKIPKSLLDGSQKLSLKLTDYPDQQLQLKLSNIPVVR